MYKYIPAWSRLVVTGASFVGPKLGSWARKSQSVGNSEKKDKVCRKYIGIWMELSCLVFIFDGGYGFNMTAELPGSTWTNSPFDTSNISLVRRDNHSLLSPPWSIENGNEKLKIIMYEVTVVILVNIAKCFLTLWWAEKRVRSRREPYCLLRGWMKKK